MEKHARTLSLVVGLFLLFFAGFLTRTSFRGDVPTGNTSTPEGNRQLTREQRLAEAASFDTTRLRQQIELSSDSTVLRVGGRARETDSAQGPQYHLRRLAMARSPIVEAEFHDQTGIATAHDAVAQLRPYWLEMTERLVVRAGGQNVGGRETLRDMRVGVVREIRLRFVLDEPHWVIELDLR